MTRPSDRRLLRYARPARAYLAGLVVATVAIAGLVILQAQLLATAIAGTFSDGLNLPRCGARSSPWPPWSPPGRRWPGPSRRSPTGPRPE